MKRFVFTSIILSFIFSAFLLSSCDKEEETNAVITVKYTADTTQLVPYAHVRLEKYDVNVEGQCNEDGVFEHTFKLEAILDVSAWLDTSQTGTTTEKYGETTIRLVPGKTVYKTVFIN
ncbi:MAG: hypothetical protein JXR53_01140 [Bacteroidales bacterium]|nr:hypothetical protein [Bacteroidales bacterium]